MDCHRERGLHEGDTAWNKRTSVKQVRDKPRAHGWDKNGVVGARTLRRLEPTKRPETPLLFEIQGVPWYLVPDAPRRGERKPDR